MIHILEIRANLKDLTLTYIKSVNPNLCNASDGKKRYEKHLELFVRELHGKGNCPHLLTLNNIYQIAAYSIEQVSVIPYQHLMSWQVSFLSSVIATEDFTR